MAYCSACHGADGNGGDKVASLATKLSALTLSEAELSRIVHDGTGGGMPSFSQIGDTNITAIVRYLRTLEAASQPDAPLPEMQAQEAPCSSGRRNARNATWLRVREVLWLGT